MITAVQGRFANLGMAKKLGVGFVLVLLLTALVAAIGVWSLQTISHRFDGLKQMSSLNSSLLKVRLLEQDYALRGDSKTADALREGVEGTPMAPWGDRLRDEEIVAAAHYTRSLFVAEGASGPGGPR